MSSHWTQDECFPAIFEVICQACRKRQDWVSHAEIVRTLLENPEIRTIARRVSYERRTSEEWETTSMLAWFSQKITEYLYGNLSENYCQYSLVQDAALTLERERETEDTYSYKLRGETDLKEIYQKLEPAARKRIEDKIMKEEFRRYVEKLKAQGLLGEEIRKLTIEWEKKWRQRRR